MANHPLQSSGQISLIDIHIELFDTGASYTSLNAAKDLVKTSYTPNPVTGNNIVTGQPKDGLHITDWYGYNHNAKASSAYWNAACYNVIRMNQDTFANARNGTGNGFGSQSSGNATDGAIFNAAATYNTPNAPYYFNISRTLFGLDTTAVTGAVSASLVLNKVYGQNTQATRIVLMQPSIVRAYNYNYAAANFTEANNTASFTLYSSPFSIPASANNASYNLPLNAAGIAYINANNSCNFAIVEYDHDYLNNSSGINASTGFSVTGFIRELQWA